MRIYATQGLSINTMYGPIQSRETVPFFNIQQKSGISLTREIVLG